MPNLRKCIASGQPWMPPAEHEALARELADCTVYLEYGAGGSTVLALQQGVQEVITVETDPACLALVEASFRNRPGRACLFPLLMTGDGEGVSPGLDSERMIRLPGLGVAYPSLDSTPAAPDWAALGLREEARIYLCAQNPAKILPRHDDLFARIATGLPDSQFLFLDSHRSHSSTRRMMVRLAAAFAARGLCPDHHLVLLPSLSRSAYAALNRRCHIFLDTIGWNGANTTLEALAAGLPVVTLPGTLMRGRHSLAILRRAGIEYGIASDADHYVEIAIRLGRDETERREVSLAALAGMSRIHADTDAVPALEDFLEAEVRRSAVTSSPEW